MLGLQTTRPWPPASGSSRHPRRALAVVLLILFLTFLDNTIVSVTLADIQATLHPGIVQLQWIINGYMLAFAALMLTGGTLGDLFGRKKVLLAGVAIFCAGSIISLIAGSTTILICGRVLMGIGAAASEPGTLSMIWHVFPDRQTRDRAIGAWAAVCAIALAMGPVLGGVIIGLWGWREVFALSFTLGILGFIAGALFLPENSDPEGRRLDVWGLLLGGVALSAASVGLIQGEAAGYLSGWILALFCCSFVAICTFVVVERGTPDPVLKLEFFRNRTFTGANLVAFVTNFGVFALFFFTALYLQIMGGFSGYDIAIAFITMAVAMILASVFTGRWVAKFGPRWPGVLGCVLAGSGLLILRSVLRPGVTIAHLAWVVAVVGLGFGMNVVATNAAVLSIVPSRRSGMAASTVNTARELGGVFGVSILGAILNSKLTTTLGAQLSRAGVPKDYQSLIISAVTHGGGRLGKGGSAAAPPGYEDLVKKAIHAAEIAFGSGLDLVLLFTGILLIVAALVGWVTLRKADTVQPNQNQTAAA